MRHYDYDEYEMDRRRRDYDDYDRRGRGMDYDDYDMTDGRRRRSSTTGRYMRDRHMTDDMRLPEEDIEMWTKSMLSEMEDRDKTQMKMDAVLKRAQDMGIDFNKFSPEEFYVTVLMIHRTFAKSMGPSPMDAYVKMAKAWLCDPDSNLRYGKKLAAYYENIVNEF